MISERVAKKVERSGRRRRGAVWMEGSVVLCSTSGGLVCYLVGAGALERLAFVGGHCGG